MKAQHIYQLWLFVRHELNYFELHGSQRLEVFKKALEVFKKQIKDHGIKSPTLAGYTLFVWSSWAKKAIHITERSEWEKFEEALNGYMSKVSRFARILSDNVGEGYVYYRFGDFKCNLSFESSKTLNYWGSLETHNRYITTVIRIREILFSRFRPVPVRAAAVAFDSVSRARNLSDISDTPLVMRDIVNPALEKLCEYLGNLDEHYDPNRYTPVDFVDNKREEFIVEEIKNRNRGNPAGT
ncbi:MAG: hypothetical protein NZO16_05520 [Deltaproteobacteria bacterium]|nr:hypothetical protein [Deltaproteobacteria bacterium]